MDFKSIMASAGPSDNHRNDIFRFLQYIMNQELDSDAVEQRMDTAFNPNLLNAILNPMPRFIGQYIYQTDHPQKSPATFYSQTVPASRMPYVTSEKVNMPTIQPVDKLKSFIITSNLFNNTNWQCIKKNEYSTNKLQMAQIAVELDEKVFIESCEESLENNSLPFVPVVDDPDAADCHIEYVKIIKIGELHAGIGIKYHNITKQLIYRFCARFINKEFVASDIITSIMAFCIIIEATAIHLDRDYIIRHHQLLSQQDQIVDYKDAIKFRPFITSLIIKKSVNEDELKLE